MIDRSIDRLTFVYLCLNESLKEIKESAVRRKFLKKEIETLFLIKEKFFINFLFVYFLLPIKFDP